MHGVSCIDSQASISCHLIDPKKKLSDHPILLCPILSGLFSRLFRFFQHPFRPCAVARAGQFEALAFIDAGVVWNGAVECMEVQLVVTIAFIVYTLFNLHNKHSPMMPGVGFQCSKHIRQFAFLIEKYPVFAVPWQLPLQTLPCAGTKPFV